MNPPIPRVPATPAKLSERAEEPRPLRTCVGCRRRRPQDELVRVVRLADGSLEVGRTLPGRGAWLCIDDPGCFRLAVERKGLVRSFRAPVRPETLAVRYETGADAPDGRGDLVPGDPPVRD